MSDHLLLFLAVCRPVADEERYQDVGRVVDRAADAGGQEEGHRLGGHQRGHRGAGGTRVLPAVAPGPREAGTAGETGDCLRPQELSSPEALLHAFRLSILFHSHS